MDANNGRRQSILTLPTELREHIYAFALARYKAAVLRAYKLRYRLHWLIRYHSGISSPPLLRVCRLIYFEARNTMLRLLGPPTVLIEHVTHFGVNHGQYGLSCWVDGVPVGCFAELRALENLLPIISGTRGLRLEIRAPTSTYAAEHYAEKVRLHALLRWMSAVLAVRDPPIQDLTALVRLPNRFATLDQNPELFGILLGLRSKRLIIESQRPRSEDLPPICIYADVHAGTRKDVERTWTALLKSTRHWPRQPWRPKKFARMLLARECASLWESFGDWLRGEL